MCSFVGESIAGGGFTLHAHIANAVNSAEVAALHVHRNLTGGGGDKGSLSMSGITPLTAGTSIGLWVSNDTNTNDFRISDCTLSALRVG